MSPDEPTPTIDTVRELCDRYSNWGRWGTDDEIGTLNFIDQNAIAHAASLVRRGATFSLAIPFSEDGPQTGGYGRFNPIHMMTRDGNDALANTTPRDFYGGRDRYIRSADDIIIMPLQCGTQWDGLSHVIFEGKIYNGYSADQVSSKGALKNSIVGISDKIVGRGVLLDIAHFKGVDWLPNGYAIDGKTLAACADAQRVEIRRGDLVLIRTGQVAEVRARRAWEDYAGGSAPGLGLGSVPWIAENEVAALATDTWGMEVLPNETEDVFQPLHIILLVHMGLTIGEIFDLETLAQDCADDGVYEFFFSAPPLPIRGAVGSPINPIVVK